MSINNFIELSLEEKLRKKIYTYLETIWQDGADGQKLNDWEANFNNTDSEILKRENLNMLYLLSKFTYFGKKEIRILLKSLFRDLYKYPIVEKIRLENDDTTDISVIEKNFLLELELTNFVSVGSGSESGAHLLMPFRHAHTDIIKSTQCKTQEEIYMIIEQFDYKHLIIKDENIKKYIFIDDFVGSGKQVIQKLEEPITLMREKLPNIKISYYSLIATEDGLKNIRAKNLFDEVESVFQLDESFKTFKEDSRYFQESIEHIDINFAKQTTENYSKDLFCHPLGFEDCQLMLGFEHNTPDNCLPLFWSKENNWNPIFTRYTKK